MAVTKIHAIKVTLGKAIDYICNPHKTDDQVLVSSFGCAPETADLDFKFTLSHTRSGSPNKAFHLIQSFLPGEITSEEANRIGKELADHLLQGKYSYVLATHVDKKHIHNHIIFCAANNIDYGKYHDCRKSYYHLRNISDQLCQEHGKSVIHDFQERGKTYKEWQAEKSGDSWKAQIRKDINECVKAAISYDDFQVKMKAKGYEINGEGFGPDAPKYISFRPAGKDRFVRGRANSLGKDYTKERIRERIEEHSKLRTEKMQNSSPSRSGFIDTSDEKFADNPGLNRWAEKENLKRFASMYAELGRLGLQSPKELNQRIDNLHESATQGKKSVVDLERQKRSFAEILFYARQYRENKRYDAAYQKSKDPDRYYREHRDQLTLLWAAQSVLKNMGIDAAAMNLEEMEKHFQQMEADCETLRKSYRAAEDERNKLTALRDSIKHYAEMHKNPSVKNQNRDI